MSNEKENIQHSILRNVATEDRPTSNIERRMIQLTMPDWMLNVECLLAIYRSWILNVFHSPIGGRP